MPELTEPEMRRRAVERLVFGASYPVAALACALLLPAGHGVNAVAVGAAALFVIGIGSHVRLSTGMVSYQQAAFVLLAFTLPLNLLPGVALVLTVASLRGGPLWLRLLVSGVNSWYVVLSVVPLALLAPGPASWSHWPAYVVALGGALPANTLLYYVRARIRRHDFDLREELTVLSVDMTLTPIGLAAAVQVRQAPGGALALMLATTALTAMMGREHDRRHAESERALSDPLTGLGNRAQFDQAAAACEARCLRGGMDAALLLIDLDNFKQINDTLGHGAGDAALRLFADALRESTRAGDLAARIGGDEFAVILAEPTDEAAAAEAARALRSRLDAPLELPGGRLLQLDISIGHALFGASATLEEAFAAADGALYADKRGHKAQGASASPETSALPASG